MTVIGYLNVPSRLAVDASSLYARNLVNFLTPHVDGETKAFAFDMEDETVTGILLTSDGKIVHPQFAGAGE